MSVRFLSILSSTVAFGLATDSFSSLLTLMLDIHYLIVFHVFVLYQTVQPPGLELGTGVSFFCMVFLFVSRCVLLKYYFFLFRLIAGMDI
jgi:hypothetical protein